MIHTKHQSAAAMRQLIGRMFSDGYIPEEERDKSLAQLKIYEQAVKEGGVNLSELQAPLPELQPSNFPVINQESSPIGSTTGSNPQLAQALNLFNKGGIVSAKKNF